MMPRQMPSEMEYIVGIAAMQRNAGTASVMSVQGIAVTCCIIMKPTMIRAGAVAKLGIARNSGEKKSDRMKSSPAKIAVRPVRPPSAIPEADSTKVVMVDVPKQAPVTVPTASERRAPLMPGSLPSLSSIFPRVAQPIRVPSVSNISTNRNASTTTQKFAVRIALKSSFMKVGAIEAGVETIPDGKTL